MKSILVYCVISVLLCVAQDIHAQITKSSTKTSTVPKFYESYVQQLVSRNSGAFVCSKSGTRTRIEIRELDEASWVRFRRALVSMYHTPHPVFKNYTYIDLLTRIHMDYMTMAHTSPQFLPWHRLFTLVFEMMVKQIDPSIDAIPYWDVGLDAHHPASSFILSAPFLGLDNTNNVNECTFVANLPKRHCVLREQNQTQLGYFYNDFQVQRLVVNASNLAPNYDMFREGLEVGPHGVVHMALGNKAGDLANMWSTNDPIFWVLHPYVDKIWAERQASKGMFEYGGQVNGRNVTLKDQLAPYGISVGQIMDTKKQLCYQYRTSAKTMQLRRHYPDMLKEVTTPPTKVATSTAKSTPQPTAASQLMQTSHRLHKRTIQETPLPLNMTSWESLTQVNVTEILREILARPRPLEKWFLDRMYKNKEATIRVVETRFEEDRKRVEKRVKAYIAKLPARPSQETNKNHQGKEPDEAMKPVGSDGGNKTSYTWLNLVLGLALILGMNGI